MNRFVLALILVACSGSDPVGPEADTDTDVDTDTDADADTDTDSDADTDTVWSGTLSWDDGQYVPPGQTVRIAAGTQVTIGTGAWLTVEGTLISEGTQAAPVVLDAPSGWLGIELDGTLQGSYLQISGSGGALTMNGGLLDLTDSVLDLETPAGGPDCTHIYDGTVRLDHVRITGCHCPLHFAAADDIDITNSIFDEAAVPIMISNSTGSITSSHIIGVPGVLDIGGGISADVGGNYWGGGTSSVETTNDAQFTGSADYSTTPFPDAGPR